MVRRLVLGFIANNVITLKYQVKSPDAKMKIKLICNKEVEGKNSHVHTDKDQIIATMKTKYACPYFNISYIFSIIFIAGGILCVFLGQRLFP